MIDIFLIIAFIVCLLNLFMIGLMFSKEIKIKNKFTDNPYIDTKCNFTEDMNKFLNEKAKNEN